jgi:hypothetical protein
MGIATLDPSYDLIAAELRAVGWVERSETHYLALGDMMGIATLHPSYDFGASANALRILAHERMPL